MKYKLNGILDFVKVFWFLSPETSDSIHILNCSIFSPLLQYSWAFYFLGRSGSGVNSQTSEIAFHFPVSSQKKEFE